MSIEAKRQIDELQKRLNVLERQNAALKRSAAGDGQGISDAPPGGGGGGDSGLGGKGRGGSSRPGTSGGGPPPAGPAGDADRASASASAVAHWEETKRLNARIEVLKKKLAAKVLCRQPGRAVAAVSGRR
eukprot:260579-Chlamydomonas_euryale.AAC.3